MKLSKQIINTQLMSLLVSYYFLCTETHTATGEHLKVLQRFSFKYQVGAKKNSQNLCDAMPDAQD